MVILVQFPDRTSKAISPASELIVHIYQLPSCPYILFRYSSDSKVSYRLACRPKGLDLPSPKYIIASGSGTLHLRNQSAPILDLPRSEYISELEQLHGWRDYCFVDYSKNLVLKKCCLKWKSSES